MTDQQTIALMAAVLYAHAGTAVAKVGATEADIAQLQRNCVALARQLFNVATP